VLFVDGLENLNGNVHDLRHHAFILNLNATRDSFPQVYKGPIVLWVSPSTFSALVRGAPDFFSVRSSVVQFPLVPEEQVSTYMASELHSADRRKLETSLLKGLRADQLDEVLAMIPGANLYVPRYAASAQRIEALVDYAEQTDGPGLQTLASIVSTTLSSAKSVPSPEEIYKEAQTGEGTCLPPRNQFFVGREEDLQALHNTLIQSGSTGVMQAISGLGGAGKTALAVEYAYRYAQDYTFRFLANASNSATLYGDYRTIAERVGCGLPADANDDAVVEATKQWLNTNKGWLLILDNADFAGVYNAIDLQHFLPSDPKGHLLITTRAQTLSAGLNVTPNFIRPLSMLSKEEALQLLTMRVKGQNILLTDEEQSAAITLAGELGYLPLALAQAAAYITARQTTFQAYLALWRREAIRLIDRARPETGNYSHTVGVTWQVSFDELGKAEQSAADLLTLCAFLAPDAIPAEIVFVAADGLIASVVELFGNLKDIEVNQAHYNELLESLTRYSLAVQDLTNVTFSIHPLVQAVRRDSLTDEEKQEWICLATAVLSQAFPRPEFENWMRCERLIAHVLTIVEYNRGNRIVSENLAWLCGQAAYYLISRGRYSVAEPLYQQALEIFRTTLPQGHPSIVTSINNLAGLYESQGRYAEAEPLYQEVLAIRQTTLPAGHPDIATTLNNLAGLYQSQGHFVEVEPLYQQALAIRQAALSEEHPDIAASLNNLAGFYERQGNFSAAEPLYQRALAINEKVFGAEHPYTAISFNNLGHLFYKQGSSIAAKPLYQRALAINEKVLGAEHPYTATILNNLAGVYESQGNYVTAESLYQRALAINEKVLGAESLATAAILNNLAGVYESQGNYVTAEPLYQRALAINEKVLGAEHPDTATILNNLANLYESQGDYVAAEPLLQRALAVCEKVLGAEHSYTAASLNNLAYLYISQGNYIAAESFLQRSLAILEKGMGVEHPSTKTVRDNYAQLRRLQAKR
jgi:tetratricopeptide (TPR) repeat protein